MSPKMSAEHLINVPYICTLSSHI